MNTVSTVIELYLMCSLVHMNHFITFWDIISWFERPKFLYAGKLGFRSQIITADMRISLTMCEALSSVLYMCKSFNLQDNPIRYILIHICRWGHWRKEATWSTESVSAEPEFECQSPGHRVSLLTTHTIL